MEILFVLFKYILRAYTIEMKQKIHKLVWWFKTPGGTGFSDNQLNGTQEMQLEYSINFQLNNWIWET